MRVNDTQLGKPETIYKGTKAAIESAFATEGMHAWAEDTKEQGYYNGTAWAWGIGAASLHDLTDVDDTGKSNGDSLVYNGTSGKWEPTVPAGGGDVLGPATSTDGHLAVWDGTDSKTLKDGGAPGGGTGIPVDGWVPITGTFTYASATTINVSSGAAAIHSIGEKIRFQNNNSGTYLYTYVVAVADTLLTVIGDAVPNATLTDAYYSHIASPVGFPQWFDYSATSTITGWSSFTIKKIFYKLCGRELTIMFNISGTSNSTNINFTAPCVSSASIPEYSNTSFRWRNNGTYGAAPGLVNNVASGNSVDFYTRYDGTTWANSGDKSIAGIFNYMI